MKTLGEKVRDCRAALDMSQKDLAEKAGIAERTIGGYETGTRVPRATQLYKLAKALEVSTEYLKDDSVDDPSYGIDRMEYVEDIRRSSGNKNAIDLETMLKENQAMFAGGEISLEEKQEYFDALMAAFVECKQAASEKFGSKK